MHTVFRKHGLNSYLLISQNISADLKGPKNILTVLWAMYEAAFRAATQHNTSCSDKKDDVTYQYPSDNSLVIRSVRDRHDITALDIIQ